MIEQSFAFSDLPRIFVLAFLELLLSADNAIVLGVLSHALPTHLRRKALFIGVASAFVLRAAALLLIAYLLEYTWIQALGAAYLIYLSIRYFTKKRKSAEAKPNYSFWKTVLFIELLDLAFAIDSIVAGVAFIDSSFSKLWIVYAGGMIGLLGMRYAANLFNRLLDHFPNLERSAYLMVGWIGVKLGLAWMEYPIPSPIFWTLMALFFLLGFFRPRR